MEQLIQFSGVPCKRVDKPYYKGTLVNSTGENIKWWERDLREEILETGKVPEYMDDVFYVEIMADRVVLRMFQ